MRWQQTIPAAAIIAAAIAYHAQTGRYQMMADEYDPIIIDTRTGETFSCARNRTTGRPMCPTPDLERNQREEARDAIDELIEEREREEAER